jgi:hypothetical protein
MPRRKGRRNFGSVRQLPSGRWQARYRDAAGKSHTAPETFTTRPEATRYLAQVETDLARGEWTDPRAGRVSFQEWAGRWQATTTNLRPNTRALHAYLLRRFLLPAFAGTALADLDLMAVRSWLAALEAERVSPNTIAKAYRLLARIMDMAVEAGLIVHNPCSVKGAATEWAPEMRVATVAQVAALAEHLSTYSQPGPDGLVFTSPEGGLLRRSNFNRRVWRPATRAAGLDGLRFHDLRHTSATLSIAAGASTRELMARMGHSSSAAALRYQHVMAGRDAAIAAALDELIEAASSLAGSPPPAPSGTRVARIGQSGSGKKRRGRKGKLLT